MSSKTKVITLTDEMQERVLELKDKLGFPSESMVIYSGITELHRKHFPPHTENQRRTPEQRITDKKQMAEAREKQKLAKQEDICKRLGGKVVEVSGGAKVCIYFTYDGKKKFEQTTPIHLLSEEIIERQFTPDKATVERLQKIKIK